MSNLCVMCKGSELVKQKASLVDLISFDTWVAERLALEHIPEMGCKFVLYYCGLDDAHAGDMLTVDLA